MTLDVSSKVQVKLADPAIARVDGQMLYPLADGTTKLEISWEGQRVEIPVTVKEAKTDRPISFALDVMPVFMRTGCNTGSCHGARSRQGWFQPLAVWLRPEWRPLSPDARTRLPTNQSGAAG